MGPGAGPLWLTRGQPGALAALARMVSGPTPHAILLVGPPAVGKTTLALDLAAGLLCLAPDPALRPCRDCRACRMIAGGNHPDLHRLGPDGPGGQVVIGGSTDPDAPRGIRDLLHELIFLPVEGSARVAIVEGASRMNEDAQHALLKALEEPPPGVTIVLCADREAQLLPTVRSRCSRIRLGPLGVRDVEALLGELGVADPADAARFAHLAEGRPGVAIAYARAPEAAPIRDEIARGLLDLLSAGRVRRLAVARELLGRAGDLADALAGPRAPASTRGRTRAPARGKAGTRRTAPDLAEAGTRAAEAAEAAGAAGAADAAAADAATSSSATAADEDAAPSSPKATAAERRRAAAQLLAIWREVARDLAVVAIGGRRAVNEIALLDDIEAAAARLPDGAGAAFLTRLDEVAESVAGNVSPELAVDVLVLAWPSAVPSAA